MIKRFFIYSFSAWFSFLSMTLPGRAFAALPALAFVPVLAQVIEGIVWRQLGRVAVQTVGVAANDGAWMVPLQSSLTSGLAMLLGIGAIVAPNTTEIEIQVDSQKNISKVPSIPVTGDLGSLDNPYPFNIQGYGYKWPLGDSTACVSSGNSNDGSSHSPVSAVFKTFPELVASCNLLRAAFAFPNRYQNSPRLVSFTDRFGDGSVVTFNEYGASLIQVNGVFIEPGVLCLGTSAVLTDDSCIFSNNLDYGFVESPDGSKRFLRSGSGFIADASDPDFSANDLIYFASPRPLSMSSLVGGLPTRVVVAVADNHTDLIVQSITAIDKDFSRFREVLLNSDNVPMTYKYHIYKTQPDTVFQTNPELLPNGSTSTNPSVDLATNPTTSAQTAEQIKELQRIGKSIDALTVTSPAPVLPSLPVQKFEDVFFKDAFKGLLSWQLPAHSSVCPTASFDAFSQTFVMDSHCQLARDNLAGLRLAMVVVFSLSALFTVLRA